MLKNFFLAVFTALFILGSLMVAHAQTVKVEIPHNMRWDGAINQNPENQIRRKGLKVRIEKDKVFISDHGIIDPRKQNDQYNHEISIDVEKRLYNLKQLKYRIEVKKDKAGKKYIVKIPEISAQNFSEPKIIPAAWGRPYHRLAVGILNKLLPNTGAVYTEAGLDWETDWGATYYKWHWNYPLVLLPPQWRVTGHQNLHVWYQSYGWSSVRQPCTGVKTWFDNQGYRPVTHITVQNEVYICARQYGLYEYWTYAWYGGDGRFLMTYQNFLTKFTW